MTAAERCGWCGRRVTSYIVHDIETDRGPAAVVWCRDWRACQTARNDRPKQSTVQTPAIRGR